MPRGPEPSDPKSWRAPLFVRISAGLHGTAAGLLALHPGLWPGLLAAVAANHIVISGAGMWPRSQALGPTLHRLPSPGRAVALTFDDGPDPDVTPQVLDQLAAAGATASFFCIGERALRHPALLRRIVAEGHRVENHTHTHPLRFACLAGSALRREIEAAQSAITCITGVPPRWFRAPMGIRSPLLDPALFRAGLHLVSWSRRGYDTRSGNPARVLPRLVRGLREGDVLLLHDGNCARSPTGCPVVLEVLPGLLTHLRASGLRGVALPGATAAAAAGQGSPASAGYAST